MRRTLAALGLTALFAQGCIIYEEHYVDTGCGNCGTDDDWTNPGNPVQPGDDDDDTDPVVLLDLYFSVPHGLPGETLLTTLQSNDANFDMTRIDSVTFSYGVEVVDQIIRPDEIVLLLTIDPDAQPTQVDAFVQGDDGATGLVAEPFCILDPSEDGTDGTDGTDTTDTGTPPVQCDINGETGDTGCP